ncbi:transposase [Burkholderia ubonensis]|uniref:transposase n=1 Tax=Burkholderia ubonensis TaxID=101571 RepID=UPI0009B45A6D|nr:transposase [Burkholderia ubonensis]
MTEKQDLRSRLVVGRRRDGRREFDEAAVQELVELCLKPGVSIARAAMDHDVNPNQLRRWISRYQQHMPRAPRDPDPMVIDGVSIDVPGPRGRSPVDMSSPPAFVPVVSPPAPAPLSPPASTSPGLSMALALHVRLPNGVEFELGEANVEELTTIVQMLGRLACSGSTKG